jgi:hypothetical protein
MNLDEFQQVSLTNGDNVKLDEYQLAAVDTSIYPGRLAYPCLGLAGELGELTAAVLSKSPETNKEIGDVLWYAANLAADCGLTLSMVVGRKTFPIKIKEADRCWGMDDILEELTIHVGRAAENIKKTIRDDDGKLCLKRRKAVKLALRRVIYLLADLTNNAEWCAPLEECARMNIEKLQSRQDRGVLRGDGDDR